jgi:pyridoxamine 5'-phosphate oxidase
VNQLTERAAGADPFRLFGQWFEAALGSGIHEPNAMALATANTRGVPSVRMVLLKGFSQEGFVFFTNYRSRKGQELERNPHAALSIYWKELNRQVRVVGRVVKVEAAESDAYFATRPVGSRVAASISQQSKPIGSRLELVKEWTALNKRYPDGDPPRPKHWGGYCVVPDEIEFWQQGEFRMHDRFRFRRLRDGSWERERLAP